MRLVVIQTLGPRRKLRASRTWTVQDLTKVLLEYVTGVGGFRWVKATDLAITYSGQLLSRGELLLWQCGLHSGCSIVVQIRADLRRPTSALGAQQAVITGHDLALMTVPISITPKAADESESGATLGADLIRALRLIADSAGLRGGESEDFVRAIIEKGVGWTSDGASTAMKGREDCRCEVWVTSQDVHQKPASDKPATNPLARRSHQYMSAMKRAYLRERIARMDQSGSEPLSAGEQSLPPAASRRRHCARRRAVLA